MIEEAVAEFRGTYLQQPPAFSAKKIDGDRAYDLARRNAPVRLQPVQVTATVARGPRMARHDAAPAPGVFRRLLRALAGRRASASASAPAVTSQGSCGRAAATSRWPTPLASIVVDRNPHEAAARVIPLAALLPSLPAITLTPEGASLAARGGFIGPSQVAGPCDPPRDRPRPTPAPRRAPRRHRRASNRQGLQGPFASFFASRRRTGIKLLVWD